MILECIKKCIFTSCVFLWK